MERIASSIAVACFALMKQSYKQSETELTEYERLFWVLLEITISYLCS